MPSASATLLTRNLQHSDWGLGDHGPSKPLRYGVEDLGPTRRSESSSFWGFIFRIL